jgi:hypothetical protein
VVPDGSSGLLETAAMELAVPGLGFLDAEHRVLRDEVCGARLARCSPVSIVHATLHARPVLSTDTAGGQEYGFQLYWWKAPEMSAPGVDAPTVGDDTSNRGGVKWGECGLEGVGVKVSFCGARRALAPRLLTSSAKFVRTSPRGRSSHGDRR